MRVWLDERRKPWRRAERRDGEVPDAGDHLSDPAVAGQRAQARDLGRTAVTAQYNAPGFQQEGPRQSCESDQSWTVT